MSLKNPVTPLEIDSGTIRLVAQHSALTTILHQAPIFRCIDPKYYVDQPYNESELAKEMACNLGI